jgi:hypothetical protein
MTVFAEFCDLVDALQHAVAALPDSPERRALYDILDQFDVLIDTVAGLPGATVDAEDTP